tara:strand:- start:108 stop:737 length:630 start_codon:yes stop_codon:yes gene_type:complete
MNKKLIKSNYRHKVSGRNIYIKPISKNDITIEYVNWLNDNEVNKYLEVRHVKQNLISIFNYINNIRSKDGCDVFGIYYNKSDLMVGTIGISHFDKFNKRLEYGLLIGDKKARQIGIGFLATILFYEYIFSEYDIIKIYNPVVDENKNAWTLVESLGSIREGILRNHFIFSSGNIKNMYLYGILKDDWLNAKKNLSTLNLKIKINKLVED